MFSRKDNQQLSSLYRYISKKTALSLAFCLVLSLFSSITARAVDYAEEAKERESMTIESNLYDNWPLGPSIGAQSAILMEANTGTVLYEKNINDPLYPASITKLLTGYIAIQHCSLDEMVTFSEEAIASIDWRVDANMGIYAGSSITMEEALYGMLVGSANEAAYAIAEHISGSIEDFADLMNQTAKELGCTNSHFVTPNGIHDDDHYTTAHDMALIAQAFFSNEKLTKISGTVSYQVPVTDTQTREGIVLTAKSQLHPGKTYAYDGLLGTKTGYTELARQTLVSCAQKNGLKLICVILKEESPAQYTDTIELFNYGFNNFSALNISENDSRYQVSNDFFPTQIDVLGSSKSLLSLDSEDYIVLPNTISFSDVDSRVSYDTDGEDEIAVIDYSYKNIPLGQAAVKLTEEESETFDFGTDEKNRYSTSTDSSKRVILVNVVYVIAACVALACGLCLIFFLHAFVQNRFVIRRRKNKLRKGIGRNSRHWDIHHY